MDMHLYFDFYQQSGHALFFITFLSLSRTMLQHSAYSLLIIKSSVREPDGPAKTFHMAFALVQLSLLATHGKGQLNS